MVGKLIVLPVTLVALVIGAGNAYACACCADKGTWREDTAKLQSFEKSELARLRFAPKAANVLTPEGRNGTYTAGGSLSGPTWRIQLSGLPALTFPAPSRATAFVADLYDGKVNGGGESRRSTRSSVWPAPPRGPARTIGSSSRAAATTASPPRTSRTGGSRCRAGSASWRCTGHSAAPRSVTPRYLPATLMRLTLLFAVVTVLALGPSAAAGPQQAAPTFTLTVKITGSGTVTSSPAGINCPSTCSAKYPSRTGDGVTTVSLSKNPDTGWVFKEWDGDCSGGGGCSVTMTANRSVTATLVHSPKKRYTLAVSVSGNGSVLSSPGGIACPGSCSAVYDEGTAVTLAPIAGAGAVFTGWGGTCSGSGICVVTLNNNVAASAAFNDRRTTPPETRPAPDTGNPDKGTSGPQFQLMLPFTCYPTDDLWLAALYQDVPKRPIDQAALDFLGAQLKAGTPRSQVALLVLRSVEYRTLLVQGFYQRFLKRLPSGPELPFFLGLLAGQSVETVEAAILGSSEYTNGRGGGTDDGFVTVLFQDILGRTPTAAEIATFKNLITQGATRAQVALAVIQSAEARTKFVQGLSPDLLGRPPSQAELDAHLAQFQQGASGEAVEAAILGSDEYFAESTTYDADINWGDGSTSPGDVQRNGERCTVVGTHNYAADGRRTIVVDVTSPDGNETTLTRPLVIVSPAAAAAGQGERPPDGQGVHQEGREVRAAAELRPGAPGNGARHAQGQGQAHLARRLDRRLLRGDLQARRREGPADHVHRDRPHRRELRGLQDVEAKALRRRQAEAPEVGTPRLGERKGPLPDEGQVRVGDGPRERTG